MFVVRSGKFQLAWMLAIALPAVIWSPASQAYTPEQQQACSDDAFRLCSTDIPDIERVTACMIAKKEQLSPGCRVFFRDTEPVTAVRAGMPLSIKPAAAQRPASAKPRRPKEPE